MSHIHWVTRVGIIVGLGSGLVVTTESRDLVSYESIKRELNKRLIFDSRCDPRLKVKPEGCTRLADTMWLEVP